MGAGHQRALLAVCTQPLNRADSGSSSDLMHEAPPVGKHHNRDILQLS